MKAAPVVLLAAVVAVVAALAVVAYHRGEDGPPTPPASAPSTSPTPTPAPPPPPPPAPVVHATIEVEPAASGTLGEFLRATDPADLDRLAGEMRAMPDDPRTTAAIVAVARSDSSLERRKAAILFLGGAVDADGSVRAALLDLAASGDRSVRSTALQSFRDYLSRNRPAAAEVHARLLEIAGGEADAELRAQAVGSLSPVVATDADVEAVGAFARDADVGVRMSAYEFVGSLAPARRDGGMRLLGDAIALEAESAVRRQVLFQLVRLGRSAAVPLLEALREEDDIGQDAAEYAAILLEDDRDLERIQAEKRRLEAER